jgi:hypothetical protein
MLGPGDTHRSGVKWGIEALSRGIEAPITELIGA